MFQNEFDKGNFSFLFIKEDEGDNLTEDIKGFIKDKKAFFFSGLDFGKQNNLNRLYKEMNIFFNNKKVDNSVYSLEDVCEYIKMNTEDRMIWIFENIEEIIEDKDFSLIEKTIKELKQTNSMMIFISRSASFSNKFEESKLTKYLANKTINNVSSFYALANDQLSAEDKFKYYAIFGDKKEYRKKIDYSKSFKSNLVDNFFNTNGFFYFEPKKILKKELRETQVYNIILEAVSKGASTLNEISDVLNMPTSICNKYLTVLISLGIINKVKPALGQDTRKSRYRISNPVMDFWYHFIPDNISDISLNNGEKVFDEKVSEGMDSYLAMKFPDICRDYINKQKKDGKIKIDIKENNIWWNKNSVIDVVAGSGLEAIVGDCYWNKGEIGIGELKALEEKAKDVDVIDREYYLFSKGGFSKELINISKERKDLTLVSFNDMVGGSKAIDEKPRKISFFFSKK